MPIPVAPIVRKSQEQFSASILAVLKERDMKKADLARASEASGGPSKKTVYNILNNAHPPKLENYAHLAGLLDVPLWVLLVDNIHKRRELLTPAALKRLVGLMQDYLSSAPADREDIETIARSGAIKAAKKT